VTYAAKCDFNGCDRFTYRVTAGGVTETANVAVTVNAVNDPVIAHVPLNLTVNEDQAKAVGGLSISDVDATLAPSGVYEATLSASHGTLTLSTLAGLTFTAGDGTADAAMTFHGTLADIDAALATASYLGNANYNGADSIVLHATDLFNGVVATGSGAATSDTKTIDFQVAPVNDAPAGADNSKTILEDNSYTFAAADFGFTDPVDAASNSGANALAAVKITTLPTAGTLTDNNVTVTAGQIVSIADLTGGKLKFAPA